jgi:hypothetical protein
MMRMLCHQLQQENLLLMQRVHSLQERLAGTPAPQPQPDSLGLAPCLPPLAPPQPAPAASPSPAAAGGWAGVPTPPLLGPGAGGKHEDARAQLP